VAAAQVAVVRNVAQQAADRLVFFRDAKAVRLVA
jgi:hypothetical protein